MKKTIQHNAQEHIIDVSKDADSISITLDGTTHTFTKQITHTGWVLQSQEKIYNTSLIQKQNDQHRIRVNGHDIEIEYKDPYALSSTSGSAGAQGEVKAVMPGRVVKIMVQEGEIVKANQPILVLEAMKMENEIKAPCDGEIEKVYVTESSSVESNAMLISIKPTT